MSLIFYTLKFTRNFWTARISYGPKREWARTTALFIESNHSYVGDNVSLLNGDNIKIFRQRHSRNKVNEQ